jgi:hypothetical protein
MIKALLLTTGHVEDTVLGFVPAVHKEGFGSCEEALKHLGEALLEAYKEDRGLQFKSCCGEQRALDKPPKHCPECGTRIDHLEDPEPDQFIDFVRYGFNNTYNEMGAALDLAQERGWIFWLEGNPFKKPQEVIVIGQDAEHWISWGAGVGEQARLDSDELRTLNDKPAGFTYESSW